MESTVKQMMEEVIKIDQAIERVTCQHRKLVGEYKTNYDNELKSYQYAKSKEVEMIRKAINNKRDTLINAQIDAINEQVKCKASGIEKKYLQQEKDLVDKLFKELFLSEG